VRRHAWTETWSKVGVNLIHGLDDIEMQVLVSQRENLHGHTRIVCQVYRNFVVKGMLIGGENYLVSIDTQSFK